MNVEPVIGLCKEDHRDRQQPADKYAPERDGHPILRQSEADRQVLVLDIRV